MYSSQLRATIYGIGQLITQRRLFSVPHHQRSFSWSTEEVEQFLSDISNAVERGANDYFIGLIVMQGLTDNSWVILDGQQRLTTATMIYAAMRHWLITNRFEQDADQLSNEYIGVRKLGSTYTSRLRLNTENKEVFDRYIVEDRPTNDLLTQRDSYKKKSSNWLLLDAAIYCRKWINEYCGGQPVIDSRAQKLFRFSAYLETSVNVIGVDVTSETDAYILFESLNDRGMNLSSLDLVKNYVFSFSRDSNIEFFQENWSTIVRNIEGKDADDFLKVFWTSRFGLVRKLELFSKIRSAYPNLSDVETLVLDLADASEKLNAIDDPEHNLWRDYGPLSRDRISQLLTLGSKQVRPVILAALSRFQNNDLNNLLWILVVIIVRFQLIGQGRTGILERNLARLGVQIWGGKITDVSRIPSLMSEIIPDDETFLVEFAKHSEFNASRLAYLLGKLEAKCNEINGKSGIDWRDYLKHSSVFRIARISDDIDPDLYLTFYSRIGNHILLEDSLSGLLTRNEVIMSYPDVVKNSNSCLMEDIEHEEGWGPEEIKSRSEGLAELAVATWNLQNSNELL